PVMRRHSKLTGDCPIRGARTPTEGSGVSSAALSSPVPAGKSTAQMFIRSASASSTRLTTNSPLSLILRSVSLYSSSLAAPGLIPSTTTGGTELTALKKLNGAALMRPEPSTVVASAEPRHNGADEELVSVRRRDLRQIETHLRLRYLGPRPKPR